MKKRIIFLILFVCLFPVLTRADSVGQKTDFFVESDFSTAGSKVSATLIKSSSYLNMYVDDSFWNSKSLEDRKTIEDALVSLGAEFDNVIYPKTTFLYGSEWTPGIDKDSKITVLFHPMKKEARGYFRNVDEYEKFVIPSSNVREMVYLNTETLSSSLLKEFLAHEFVHLITFNQKDTKYNVIEDTWLNEARAEYIITYLGYNNKDNSYLDSRISTFVENPSDSLVDWSGEISDYGSVTLFIHYLVDYYGVDILSDSLRSNKIGIESIEYALARKGYKKTFSDIFSDWVITVYLNDCKKVDRYCYKNTELKDVHIIPFNNFLPFFGDYLLSMTQSFSGWSAQWQKFSGARNNVKISFDSKAQKAIKVVYIVKDFSDNYEVKELTLNSNSVGEISINGLGKDKASVIIIPYVADKAASQPSTYFYSLTANIVSQSNNNQNNSDDSQIVLPFEIDKPLTQMNREELLMVLLRLVIYFLMQGKTINF